MRTLPLIFQTCNEIRQGQRSMAACMHYTCWHKSWRTQMPDHLPAHLLSFAFPLLLYGANWMLKHS